jgi:hypothetical protein
MTTPTPQQLDTLKRTLAQQRAALGGIASKKAKDARKTVPVVLGWKAP